MGTIQGNRLWNIVNPFIKFLMLLTLTYPPKTLWTENKDLVNLTGSNWDA